MRQIWFALCCLLFMSFAGPGRTLSAEPAELDAHPGDSIPGDIRQFYLDENFDCVIDACEFTPPVLEGTPDGYTFRGFRNFMIADIAPGELTDKEMLMLGYLESGEGHYASCAKTLLEVCTYFELTGRLPVDGVDLLVLYNDRWVSDQGFSELMGMTPVQVSETRILKCINPGTGRFYDSFSCPEWSPLGVSVSMLTGEDALQVLPGLVTDAGSEDRGSIGQIPYQMWRIQVFGEEPGRVLVDWTIGRPLGSGGSSGGLCSCR